MSKFFCIRQKFRCHLASDTYMIYYEAFHNTGQSPLYLKLRELLKKQAEKYKFTENLIKKSFNENGFYFKIKPEAKAFNANCQRTIPEALHGCDVMAELKITPYYFEDTKICGISIEVLNLTAIKH